MQILYYATMNIAKPFTTSDLSLSERSVHNANIKRILAECLLISSLPGKASRKSRQ